METKTIQKRNTFSMVCLVRKNRVLKNGEAPLFLRITVNGKTADIPIRGSVNLSQWSQAQGKTRGTGKDAQELNYSIQFTKSKILHIHRELEMDDKPISAQIIKDIYLGNDSKDDGKRLLEIHSDHNERCRKLLGIEYAKSTIFKFDTSLRYLKEFMETVLEIEDISVTEINEEYIRKYELFLKTEKSCANNSAIKHLKIFKKIIRIALLNDWLQKDPFASVKFRQDEVHVEFLTMHELNSLISKEMPCKRLEQIRDVFVFCCFTGLAFIDIKGLQAEHIISGNNGEMWIRKPRVKTNNMCNIPLLKMPVMLLEKYVNDKGCKERGQLLPVPTNQKYNAYLKEIADLCNINKRLTAHCSRHTFATTITLANKVTMENVAKMLGHSSTRMTQHYAKVMDQSILEDMMNVDNKLFANL